MSLVAKFKDLQSLSSGYKYIPFKNALQPYLVLFLISFFVIFQLRYQANFHRQGKKEQGHFQGNKNLQRIEMQIAKNEKKR